MLTTETALPPGMGFYAHIGDTDGIRVASIIDPFGNLVGLIENPHFKAGHGG